MKKFLHIAGIAVRAVLWALIALLIILCVYTLIQRYVLKNPAPTVFGYASGAVVSGSMEPEINIGDFVITKSQDSYAVGDVIMFISEDGVVTTHQIIGINENGQYITKGVHNEGADTDPVPPANVVGKVIQVWRNFGNVAEFFQTPAGIFVIIAAGVIVWLIEELITGVIKKHTDEA